MGLDIRWPIGLMFSLVGLLMAIFGFATKNDSEMYARSLDINVNLIWGIILLLFGAFMLIMAMRKKADAGAPGQK